LIFSLTARIVAGYMEMVDIIDGDDNVIGQALKSDCHRNASLVHRTVHFTLIDPSARRVMISRRSYTKPHDGGKLCFLGEHVLAGEGYDTAVHRGVVEELSVEATALREVGEHIFTGSTFTERVKMFLVSCAMINRLRPDPDEVAALEWHTVKQLGDLVVSEMTRYWVDHIDWTTVFTPEED
jgi:isopentenyldiphosphate isomerase